MENKAIKITVPDKVMKRAIENAEKHGAHHNLANKNNGNIAEYVAEAAVRSYLQSFDLTHTKIKISTSYDAPKLQDLCQISHITLQNFDYQMFIFAHVLINPENECSACWILGYMSRDEFLCTTKANGEVEGKYYHALPIKALHNIRELVG